MFFSGLKYNFSRKTPNVERQIALSCRSVKYRYFLPSVIEESLLLHSWGLWLSLWIEAEHNGNHCLNLEKSTFRSLFLPYLFNKVRIVQLLFVTIPMEFCWVVHIQDILTGGKRPEHTQSSCLSVWTRKKFPTYLS